METRRFPSGPLPAPQGPAGGDGRRTCSNCGAQHPAGARFCWRCYAPVSTYGRTPVAAVAGRSGEAPVAGAAAHSGRLRYPIVDTEVTHRRGRLNIRIPSQVRSIATLAALILLGAALFRGSPYEMPQVIGAIPHLEGPSAVAVETQWHDALSDAGLEADVAVFGNLGIPQYLVVAYGGRPASSDQALRSLAEKWELIAPPIRSSSSRSFEFNGDNFSCAPFSAGEFQTVCAWADPKGFVAAVISYGTGFETTLQIATTVVPALRG